MTLMIREAVPDDMGQVHGMMGLLARHHGDAATITLAELQVQIFADRRGRVLVAAEEEGLVGYALILARPNFVSGGAGLDIHHLFVVEWRRRAGVGRALIAAARRLGAAEGAEALTISALLNNPGAVAAYRAMGLEELPWHGVRFKVA